MPRSAFAFMMRKIPAAAPRLVGFSSRSLLAVSVLLAVTASCGGGAKPHTNSGRVLLIALDGATWDLIDPLIEKGRMPNFERLRREGASGPLESINPMLSPIIFTTIATGRRPEQHGIRGFTRLDKSGREVSYTNSDRKVRAVWNILSDRDWSVTVIGWFTSWPADIVHGSFISDRNEGPLPGGSSPAELDPMLKRTSDAYPAEAAHRDAARFLGPPIDSKGQTVAEAREHKSMEDAVDHYYRVDALRLEWAKQLLQSGASDFTAVFFKGTDPVSHLTWVYMDPEPLKHAFIPTEAEKARYGVVIPRYYEYIDEAVGKLVAAAPAGTDVVIVSDHGFGPSGAQMAYHANPVLARFGWAEANEDGRPDPHKSLVIDPTPQGKDGKNTRRLSINKSLLAVRASGSAARGALVEDMAGKLRALRSDAGEPLFTEVKVAGGDDAAAGEDTRYALDITINKEFSGVTESARGMEVTGKYRIGDQDYPLSDIVTFRRDHTGAHMINGILLMSGPRIRPGAKIEGASVYDIAPTLLRMYGLSPSSEMKGMVLVDALRLDLLPPAPDTVKSYETSDPIQRVEAPAMPEVEEELQDRLRTLGYIQ